MQKNELILLDARIVDVIDDAVFRAELPNGHRFTALAKDKQGRSVGSYRPRDRVQVAMSPYDMSQGHIVPLEKGNRVQ
jgi:translation initiation factor IF-1